VAGHGVKGSWPRIKAAGHQFQSSGAATMLKAYETKCHHRSDHQSWDASPRFFSPATFTALSEWTHKLLHLI